jgi:WD40 repeat protein
MFLILVVLWTRSQSNDQSAADTSAAVPLTKAPSPDSLPAAGGPGMPEKPPPATATVPRPSQRARAAEPSPSPIVSAKLPANDINAGTQAQRPAPRVLAPAEANPAKVSPSKSPQAKAASMSGNQDPDPIAVTTQSAVPVIHPRIIRARGKMFAHVAISPDGKFGWYSGYPSALVDLASGKELGFSTDQGYATDHLAFTPDGHRALAHTSDRSLRLWSLPDGALVRTFDGNDHPAVQDIVISSDGKRAAAARGIPWSNTDGTREMRDCGVSVWDMATGREVRAWDWAGQPVNRAAFSLDGNRVFAKRADGRQSSIGVFDVTTGEALPRLRGPSTGFARIGFVLAPDGRNLVIAAYPGAVLWDTEQGVELRRFAHGNEARGLAACGRGYVVTCGGTQMPGRTDWENCDIRVWNASTGRMVFRLEGHTRAVYSVAISADGRFVLSGDMDGGVFYWQLPH